MATRKTAKAKSAAELKQQLVEAKKRVAALEQRAYAEELTELITATRIVEDFNRISAQLKEMQPIAILAAIGAAVGVKRLTVSQELPAKRSAADPNKSKQARAKSVSAVK